MIDVVYIDPQSYNNLSLYDKGVLCKMPKGKVIFIGSSLWDCEQLENVMSFLWFKYNSYTRAIPKLISYSCSLRKIAHFIRNEHPKIVHIQWARFLPLDIPFLKFLRSNKIKIVYTAHNVLPHDSGMKYKKGFGKYYNLVDHIIVHSQITKKELMEIFNLSDKKISVIPHGMINIEEDEVKVKDKIAELKIKYNLGNKLIFSSVGLQTYYKGVDNIVNIWATNPCFANNSDCHLMLIGKNDGIDVSSLTNLSNVTIVDERISNIDFLSFIRLSDVILLPYRKISQSGVLFSALANNVPIIVSEVGGLPDPLKIGHVGWNIGEPTKENLENTMMGIKANPNILSEVSSNTIEFDKVKKHYDWSRISNLTLDLYNMLLSAD